MSIQEIKEYMVNFDVETASYWINSTHAEHRPCALCCEEDPQAEQSFLSALFQGNSWFLETRLVIQSSSYTRIWKYRLK